jgi:hypothetical protein
MHNRMDGKQERIDAARGCRRVRRHGGSLARTIAPMREDEVHE